MAGICSALMMAYVICTCAHFCREKTGIPVFVWILIAANPLADRAQPHYGSTSQMTFFN